MKKILTAIVLHIAGVTALYVGLSVLFMPAQFYEAYGIKLAGNINLTNELKAIGGFISVFGILALVGAYVRTLSPKLLALSAIFYLSFGISRALSLALDGLPTNSEILLTMAIELANGVLCLFTAFWNRTKT